MPTCTPFRHVHIFQINFNLFPSSTIFSVLCMCFRFSFGTHRDAVGRGIALQAGTPRVWFPMVSLGFFIDIMLSVGRAMDLELSQSCCCCCCQVEAKYFTTLYRCFYFLKYICRCEIPFWNKHAKVRRESPNTGIFVYYIHGSVHRWYILTFGAGIIFFLILAHSVYKMWIIQEPNMLELW